MPQIQSQMKTFFLVSIFLTSFFFGFSNTTNNDITTNCPEPTNVTKVNQTDSSVTFEWDDCGCAANEYRVFYVKDGQASQEFVATGTNITLDGLTAGNYQVHFYTVCGGMNSFIIVEEVAL